MLAFGSGATWRISLLWDKRGFGDYREIDPVQKAVKLNNRKR